MELSNEEEVEEMSKYKNHLENKEGFTLIEVILSIAILGIISITFLSMFTSGMVGISNSGKKSVDNYDAQSKIENEISVSRNLLVDVEQPPFIMKFSGIEYKVSGRQIDVPYTYGSITKKLTTFIVPTPTNKR